MLNLQWDHVHLRSPDPEATAGWFERMLGAQVIRSMQEGQPRVDLKLGGQMVFIAKASDGDGTGPSPVSPYQGLDHIGLSVKNIDDVVAGLKAKGAGFMLELNTPRPGIRMCYMRGPEGVCVELLERDARYKP